jgi:iron complex outermembrane receptor protein
LADASLEQLLNTPVTSVSKKEQALARTAAAVFVISQDDIRRSGADTIPDLLRMVPGVQVAQINANSWAVSIRGFNQKYSNKLLVLVDGRSLYAIGFGGVYWDQVDIPLRDIERIEVIRGPGASVWGANAVNGVIDIITKSSKATKGGYAEAGGNSDGGAQGHVRYGDAAGTNGAYRASADASRFGDSILPGGDSAHDSWFRSRAGFRSDWDVTPSDSLTVEGSGFVSRAGALRFSGYLALPTDTIFGQNTNSAGADLLARWTHTSPQGAESSLQVFYDHFRRDDSGVPEVQSTFDMEFQRHAELGAHQDVVWGFGYRASSTAFGAGYPVALHPPIRVDSLASAFFQDEIRLSNRFWLTVGSKLEHNDYTGFEFEPNARLAYTPSKNHTLWASASRAIRQPTRLETGVSLTMDTVPVAPGLVYTLTLIGNTSFRSEELRDFEAGYRGQLSKNVSVDVDSFFSLYKHLSGFEQLPIAIVPGPVTQFQIPFMYSNGTHAIDYGGEASLNWAPVSRWRIAAGYSMLHMNVTAAPGDTYSVNANTYAPVNSFQLRSSLTLTRRLEWNQSFYWSQTLINGAVPSHARLDSRLEYRLSESVAVALSGQNLLSPGFMEFGNLEQYVGSLAPRTVTGKVTWTF